MFEIIKNNINMKTKMVLCLSEFKGCSSYSYFPRVVALRKIYNGANSEFIDSKKNIATILCVSSLCFI